MTFNVLLVAQKSEMLATTMVVVDEAQFPPGGAGSVSGSNAAGAAAVCARNVVEVER